MALARSSTDSCGRGRAGTRARARARANLLIFKHIKLLTFRSNYSLARGRFWLNPTEPTTDDIFRQPGNILIKALINTWWGFGNGKSWFWDKASVIQIPTNSFIVLIFRVSQFFNMVMIDWFQLRMYLPIKENMAYLNRWAIWPSVCLLFMQY